MWNKLNECINSSEPSSNLESVLENCLNIDVPDQVLTTSIREKIIQLFDHGSKPVQTLYNLFGLAFIKLCNININADKNACDYLLHLIEDDAITFCQNASHLINILCLLMPYEDDKKETIFSTLKNTLFISSEERIQEACVRVFDMFSHKFNYDLSDLRFTENELNLIYDLCFHRNLKLREASLGIFVSYVEVENILSHKTYLDQLKRFVPFIEDRTDEIVLSSLLIDDPGADESMHETTTLYRNFIEGAYVCESMLLFDQESHNTLAIVLNKHSDMGCPPNYPVDDFEYSFEDEDTDLIRHIAERYGLQNSFWLTALRSRLNKIRYFENIDKDFEFLPNVFQLPQ